MACIAAILALQEKKEEAQWGMLASGSFPVSKFQIQSETHIKNCSGE